MAGELPDILCIRTTDTTTEGIGGKRRLATAVALCGRSAVDDMTVPLAVRQLADNGTIQMKYGVLSESILDSTSLVSPDSCHSVILGSEEYGLPERDRPLLSELVTRPWVNGSVANTGVFSRLFTFKSAPEPSDQGRIINGGFADAEIVQKNTRETNRFSLTMFVGQEAVRLAIEHYKSLPERSLRDESRRNPLDFSAVPENSIQAAISSYDSCAI